MNAGVNQFVVNDKIATLRQCRENRKIRHITTAEIERRFSTEVSCGLTLQRLVLVVFS